jgi:hypothetical protein
MAAYRIHFVDYEGNVYAVREVERDNDQAAIDAALGLNVVLFEGFGFEVWQDERIVHRYRNQAERHDRPIGPAGLRR